MPGWAAGQLTLVGAESGVPQYSGGEYSAWWEVQMGNRLNPEQRQHDLSSLAEDVFEVVVIGGGVTGAGIALDAASRGFKTAILEAQDWAAGASSRSTRLVLGGLRYLYQFDVGLVREAIQERSLLVRTIAPHLVKPLPFVWPLRAHMLDRVQSLAGIALYDTLSRTVGRSVLPAPRQRSRGATISRVPALRSEGLIGAIEFHEARVDDARLVITLVRTAVEYGARAVSRAQVVRMTRAADAPMTGLVVRDLETGHEHQVRTNGVIIATGVWTEHTQSLAQTSSGLRVQASKGIHLVVPRDRIDSEVGIFARTRDSAISLVPMPDHWVIGTTDTAWHQPCTHPVPTSADIDRLLAEVNKLLARPLGRDDIHGTYAGLRPLLQRGRMDQRTTKVSREHSVAQVAPGIVSVAGGKLTTYRLMAKDAVDFLLGPKLAAEHPSVTHTTPLLGAQGIEAMTNQSERIGGIYGWSRETMSHLLERYGSELPDLLEMVDDDPTLAAPLHAAPQYLRVEVARACVAEGAQHLEDILVQRVRLNSEHLDRGAAAVHEVGAIAAPLLDWDAARLETEKQNYLARVAAERAAETAPTDAAAAAARLQAREIVPSSLG